MLNSEDHQRVTYWLFQDGLEDYKLIPGDSPFVTSVCDLEKQGKLVALDLVEVGRRSYRTYKGLLVEVSGSSNISAREW